MEFIGYAIKRTDTGEYWHKVDRWNHVFPTVYEKRGHAICAGKYHIHWDKYDVLKVVKIKSITIDVEEENG